VNLLIFAVRDAKSDQFGTPMFLVSAGQALRSFSDEVNSKSDAASLIAKHPSDFDLFQLGSYDTETGLFSCAAPRQLALGRDLVVPAP
jgi:hypothetical protein